MPLLNPGIDRTISFILPHIRFTRALTHQKANGNKNRSEEEILAKHPSAIKRHRESLKRMARNRQVKSRIRSLVKKVRGAIATKDKAGASSQLKEINRVLDKAVSKGILPRNAASRGISRLARAVHQLQ
jgi:small subunit ribosomal protein S20